MTCFMYYTLSPVTNQIVKKSSTHDFEFSQPLIFQWAVRDNCFVESEKVSESDVTKSYFLDLRVEVEIWGSDPG